MTDRVAPRPADAHKGTFGTVGVVGGRDDDRVMVGAPALTARAAIRAGCGRVVIAAPRTALGEILTICPEATGLGLDRMQMDDAVRTLEREVQALAVGPGLGVDEHAAGLVRTLVETAGPPVVLDADAITALAGTMPPRPARVVVLTPHPGEFARLCAVTDVEPPGGDEAARTRAAADMADALGAVVVLKGHGTVVASPGDAPWTCAEGGVELAVAGTGDVLTGILASLLAQRGADDCVGSARLAVTWHARAGARWRSLHGDKGLLASELVDLLPEVG